MDFPDFFSATADEYARARPEYPDALFPWIAGLVASHGRVWDVGCGNGQASRGLATVFASVHATDPSAAQIARAHGPGNITFAVEAAEHCSLPDASVDAICTAQALHWFDRPRFFAECVRVLRPGGVLVAWGYQDILAPPPLSEAVGAFQDEVEASWPPQRALVDDAYAALDWPFPAEAVTPPFDALRVRWPLARLLAYFSSYSATQQYRDRTGIDPVQAHAAAIAAAWGDPAQEQSLHWPFFVHVRRKP